MSRGVHYLQNARSSLLSYISSLEIGKAVAFPLNIPIYISASASYLSYIYYLQQASNACADDDKSCFDDKLTEFGVSLRTNPVFIGNTQFNPREFDAQQTEQILIAMEEVADEMAIYVSDIRRTPVSPIEAFMEVFGPVQFGYFPATENYSLTVQDYANFEPDGAIVVMLADSAFGPFQNLPQEFVIVHELGHVFHFRYDLARESDIVLGYSNTVGALHALFANRTNDDDGQLLASRGSGGQITVNGVSYQLEILTCKTVTNPTDNCSKDVNPLEHADLDGNVNTGADYYFLPQGTYLLGNGSYGTYAPDNPNDFFPNEFCNDAKESAGLCHPNKHPMEGFADTFANFILRPDDLPSDEVRKDYFDNNFSDWTEAIIDE